MAGSAMAMRCAACGVVLETVLMKLDQLAPLYSATLGEKVNGMLGSLHQARTRKNRPACAPRTWRRSKIDGSRRIDKKKMTDRVSVPGRTKRSAERHPRSPRLVVLRVLRASA